MIHRPKSFSKGGAIIDRTMQIQKYDIDPTTLKAMLAPKLNHRRHPTPSHLSVHQAAFDKVTGREKPNPFLISQIKDTNTHLEYQDRRKASEKVLPVNRTKGERLSGLFAKAKQTKEEQ